MIFWHIFGSMILASVAAVGGGYGSIAVAQATWVNPTGVTPSQFALVVGLGQVTPGPWVIFVVGLGWLLAGPLGAASALFGIFVPSWLISCVAGAGMERFRRFITPYSRPIPWIVSALALATGLRMAIPLHLNVSETVLMAGTVLVMATGKVDPRWVIGIGTLIGSAMGFMS